MIESIDNLLDIFKTLLAIIPFLILCFASRKVNLKKEERNKQFLMPILSLVFVIATMLMLRQINSLLLTLINNIPIWLKALVTMPWIPDNISTILQKPVDGLLDIVNSLNMKYWIFYISNTTIIMGYLVYKKICICIFNKIFEHQNKVHDLIVSKFYTYFEGKGIWCLKDNYIQARTFAKVTYYIVAVMTSIIMLVSGRIYIHGFLADIFYPTFSVILVGEIFFFFDGVNKSEYLKYILGEDENSYKIVNYSLLRKYLRNIFGDKLISENTNVNVSMTNDITNQEVLEELQFDSDQKINAFATYFTKLNKQGFDLDHNLLNSSLDMLKGKSILFNNPFYKDLIPYAFYPMNRVLLSHKKVLVILGRHSIENDIVQWLKDGIKAVTNIPFMWNIGVLDETEQNLDIGILTRSSVTNIDLQKYNEDFLEHVEFVVILEPSKLISTAQVGLNLLVKRCKRYEDKNIVFCLNDKNCDGLVDAMSHILMTSITEVSATNKHKGTSSYMCWEADGDYVHHRQAPNISKYLGMGTEISFAALKNQVSKVTWFGGDAFPVTDMSWIARQYYYDLMKYAALPTSQEKMTEYFKTSSNFWSAEISKHNFFIIEDESYNMFEILRNFSTRSTEQGFINVISSSYLLKDYMSDNNSIFETDPKAIPYLVADYARTNRNIILGLILLMSEGGLEESSLQKEMELIGLKTYNLRKQLWFEIYKNLSSTNEMKKIPNNYVEAMEYVLNMPLILPDNIELYIYSVIKTEERYNFKLGKMQRYYVINNKNFINAFVTNLKSASYIFEDEKGETYYLGSELCDHIYQKVLPGQCFTYGGKYYEMLYVTNDGQVLVRRAADHIDGRPQYRQIRNYKISYSKCSNGTGSVKTIDGITITHMNADFTVNTQGYYKMRDYSNFKTAKKVLFDVEIGSIPNREYYNKSILKIDLPNVDNDLTNEIRYMITMLLNEVFRTLFAENSPYIVALTDDSHLTDECNIRPLTYTLNAKEQGLDINSIYIIEDSSLDLGLIITVERNLQRILYIIEDYLLWNKRSISISLNPPKKKEMDMTDGEKIILEKEKKENIFIRMFKAIGRFFKKIRRLFKKLLRKIFKRNNIDDNTTDTTVENDSDLIAEIEQNSELKESTTETDNVSEQEESTIDTQSEIEEPVINDSENNVSEQNDQYSRETVVKTKNESDRKFERKPYHERYYLLFGDDKEPNCIDTKATLKYIKSLNLGNNPLEEARKGKSVAKFIEETYKPNKKNARYCDFCGSEIYGVEYETLADGRDRCIRCSGTAIKTEKEFIEIFEDVKRNLESFFGIRINAPIRVEMVNAAKLHKALKMTFVPTSDFDGRVLGVAINKNNNFTLMVENSSPRMMSMLTIAHELTHIWQYLNWDDKAIKKKYGKKLYLQIYEGMAKWVEVQYAYLINEPATAKREEILAMMRKDEYGFGFIRYKANYPFSTGTVITNQTPFMNIETPLDLIYCESTLPSILLIDNESNYDEE